MARVSGIVTPSRGSRRRLIELDGEPWRATAVDAVRALGWREGLESEGADLAAALDQAEASTARERALRLLTVRDRGVAELAQRLTEDGFPPEVGQRVVADLAASGYMDDSRSARAYVRGQSRVRGTGRSGIAARLRARGYDDDTVAAALDVELPVEDESQAAAGLARRYARAPGATVAKVAARLARKGYPPAVALGAARAALTGRDDLPDAPDDGLG